MKKLIYSLALLLLPIVTFAQGFNTGNIEGTIDDLSGTLSKIIGFIIGIAVVVFLWGVVKYVLAGGDDPEKRKNARMFMVWGIIAIFVMVSVWGIVNLMQGATGIEGGSVPPPPGIPGVNN